MVENRRQDDAGCTVIGVAPTRIAAPGCEPTLRRRLGACAGRANERSPGHRPDGPVPHTGLLPRHAQEPGKNNCITSFLCLLQRQREKRAHQLSYPRQCERQPCCRSQSVQVVPGKPCRRELLMPIKSIAHGAQQLPERPGTESWPGARAFATLNRKGDQAQAPLRLLAFAFPLL